MYFLVAYGGVTGGLVGGKTRYGWRYQVEHETEFLLRTLGCKS